MQRALRSGLQGFVVIGALLVLAPVSHATNFFMGLGSSSFSAEAVSADGSVVVGTGNPQEAFRWTEAGGLVGLGNLPGESYSNGEDVSADGSVVVGDSGGQAFRWTEAGGVVGLGLLPAFLQTGALGVSGDGSVVVGYGYDGSGSEPFRWTEAGGLLGLGQLAYGGEPFGFARAASADGSVVVGASSSTSGAEAFRWTETGGMVGLGDLAGGDFYSSAFDVSADGSVVVGDSISSSGREAFRWTEADGMVGLGNFGDAWDSAAHAMSADGSIVVGGASHQEDFLLDEAFIWDATHGMRQLDLVLEGAGLDLTGWRLISANDVSADGRTFVGWGWNPSGGLEAWVAVIPEPGTGVLLSVGLVALGAWPRRCRTH